MCHELPNVYGHGTPLSTQVKYRVAEFSHSRVSLDDSLWRRPEIQPVKLWDSWLWKSCKWRGLRNEHGIRLFRWKCSYNFAWLHWCQKSVHPMSPEITQWERCVHFQRIIVRTQTHLIRKVTKHGFTSMTQTSKKKVNNGLATTVHLSPNSISDFCWQSHGVMLTDYPPRGQTILTFLYRWTK